MKPEVSVIIPTYNSQAYIAQAIESVLEQTFKNWEIILVDDASTDSTLAIARSFSDSRIKIISNQDNRGVSYSRNRGLEIAQGEWIALLDSDDWYAPQRLAKLLLAAKQTNADLIADDLYLIRDHHLQPWSTLLQEKEQTIATFQTIDAIALLKSDRPNPINAKRNWSLGYTKPLLRREFLLQHHIKYNETIHVGEDFILYLECLSKQARFILLPQAYYYYRTREASLSTRKPTEYLSDSCDLIYICIHQEIKFNGNSPLLKILFENLIIYQKRLAYYRVIEAIKQKQIFEAVKQILHNPYTLGTLVFKLIGIVQTKFRSIVEFESVGCLGFSVASIDK